MDEHAIKIGLLQDLMDKMRDADGERIRPKAVEVEVSAEKPLEMEGKTDDITGNSDYKEGDDLSPEDVAILGQLFGDKDDEAGRM
jgi:hypothetical protein